VQEFLRLPTIKDLGGRVVDLLRHIDHSEPDWGATNPSIGFNGKSVYATTIRSSNYHIDRLGRYIPNFGNKFLNRVYFSEFDRDWKLKKLRQINFDGLEVSFGRGVEDAKLFYRDGWWMTGVVMEKTHTPSARMAVFKLDTRKNVVTDYIKFPGKDFKVPEKNWMVPYDINEFFDFVYGPNQVVTGHVINTWMTDNQDIYNLRGGSNLIKQDDDTYYGVMHRTFFNKTSPYVSTTFATVQSQLRDYVHYFVQFDKFGYIQALSPGFRFHKPGVEFAAGLVFKGDEAVISFGRNDVSSHLAFINKSVILESLVPVTY
jgi:hypothetical protein